MLRPYTTDASSYPPIWTPFLVRNWTCPWRAAGPGSRAQASPTMRAVSPRSSRSARRSSGRGWTPGDRCCLPRPWARRVAAISAACGICSAHPPIRPSAHRRSSPWTEPASSASCIARIPTHHAPRATHAVVRLGGGTGLNSIPQNAWFDLDLRSEDPRALEKLDAAVQAILTQDLEEENRHRVPGTAPVTIDVRRVGDRPSGLTPRTHPLVQTAVAATRAVGHEHQLACASTDANVPIALGVPAVALGAGGRAGDAHLPTEWYEY